jgi:hypothetical protein
MAFNLPQRTSIGARVPVSPAVWTRQPDWISITGVSSGQILFLVSDATNAIYNLDVTKTGVGNVYIDWGDGTSTSFSGNSVQSHTYTTGGTACSLGYNTWKITMTTDVAVRMTDVRFTYATQYSEYPSGVLEAWYGNTTLTSASNLFGEQNLTIGMWHTYLEYVKLPEGMTDANSLLRVFFNGCPSLRKVTLPTSLASGTTLQETFYNCPSLIELNDFPVDMTGVTSMSFTFYQCYALSKIVLPPSFPNLTTFSSTFLTCVSLNQIILPDTPSCTGFTSIFSSCVSLQSVQIKSMASSGSVSFVSAFSSCNSIRNIVFPNNTPNTTTLDLGSTFSACFNLLSLVLPPLVKVSSYLNTFLNCYSLKSISLPMDYSAGGSFSNTFQNCYSLTNITLPSTAPSAGAPDFTNAFSSCFSLSEVTIPSTYNIGSLNSTFNLCRSLKSVTLPNNSQNQLASCANTFTSCNRLQSVVLPTSMNNLVTASSMFSNCFSLTGVTFPASLSACTIMGSMFISCLSLQTVTLPTLIAGGGVCFVSMFSGAQRIKSITLPATITNNTSVTSFASTFLNCFSLTSITLPTSNLTALATASSTFNACRSLTGITNMSSFGGSATGGTIITTSAFATDARSLLSLTLPSRLNKLEVNGTTGTGNQSNMTSLRLSNAGTGQWGGTSPQIDVSYTSLSTAALNLLFGDMAAQGNVTTKTINITSATGAAGLSAANRLVITSKGWTITG